MNNVKRLSLSVFGLI